MTQPLSLLNWHKSWQAALIHALSGSSQSHCLEWDALINNETWTWVEPDGSKPESNTIAVRPEGFRGHFIPMLPCRDEIMGKNESE